MDFNNQTGLSATTSKIIGSVITEPDINGDKLSTIIKTTDNEKVLLTYFLQTEVEKNQLKDTFHLGLICTFSGSLKEPEVSRNPSSFNYKKYLYTERIHWIFEVHQVTVDNCSAEKKLSLKRLLLQVRQRGIEQIQSHFNPSNAGIIQALIYGERRNIDVEVTEAYQSLGLIHLLAISGLHVSLMSAMFFYLCIRIGLTRETATILLLVILPVYVIIAGASPSVVRSVLMSMLVLAGILWWKKSSLLDVISLACIVMLVIDPYTLSNIGFQLSFFVSFSLVLSSSVLFKHYKTALASLFVVSFVSQISSLPILLYHFYGFSLISLLLNMVFVPLYSIIVLPLSLITVVPLGVIEPIGKMLATVLSLLLHVINEVVVYISGFSFTVLTLGKPSVLLMILYIITFFYYLYQWEKNKKFLHWSFAGPILIILIHFYLPYMNPHGEVTMLDVGQGDSIYIELPFRKAVYLIDTGGTVQFEKETWKKRRSEFSTSEDIILPFLASKGVRKIDKLIITHGDLDHIGGAKGLLENIKVNQLLLASSTNTSELEKELIFTATQQKVKLEYVQRGDTWGEGDIPFYILGPVGNEPKENNNSIIIYTKLGKLTWLFTGDLEKEGEYQIVSAYPGLVVDVLKVGHHGSQTSTSEPFLEMLHPKIALIPVGKNNRFNHPHSVVVERLDQANVKVFRTDTDGAISYYFSKNTGTFMTTIP